MISVVGNLINILDDINFNGEWETYFYKSSHKKFKIKHVNIKEGIIDGIRVESIDKYKEKLIEASTIVEYGSFDDNDSVKALDLNSECIKNMYSRFLDCIDGKEILTEGDIDPKDMQDSEFDGYILSRMYNDERVFIFYKTKLTSNKKILFTNVGNNQFEVVDNSKIVTLSNKIDFVIIGDCLYSLDYKFEKVFYVGDFLSEKIKNIIEEMEKTGKFMPSSIFALRNSKSKRQLLNFDPNNYELLTENNLAILENYTDIEYKSNQIAFEEEYSAKVFIRLMAGKIFFSDGKAYTGTKEELHRPIEEVKYED